MFSSFCICAAYHSSAVCLIHKIHPMFYFVYSKTRNRNITVSDYISGITGNQSHDIVGASVARMTYFLKFDVELKAGKWVSRIFLMDNRYCDSNSK